MRVELGFRWDAEPQAVVATFRKFVGSRFSARNLGKQIRLEGRKIRHVTEEDEAHMSVVLEGVIPGTISPGNYYCKFVHFLSLGGEWVLVFENLALAIKVVNGAPAHREREGAWLYEIRFLGLIRMHSSDTLLSQLCVVAKVFPARRPYLVSVIP